MAYLGESFKMCANISYILITINRYMLIGREHSPLLERIAKLELKNIVACSIMFSLALNIGHIFQFEINYWKILTTKPLSEVNYQYSMYPYFTFSYEPFLSVFLIIYFFIDFFSFLFLHRRDKNLSWMPRKSSEQSKWSFSIV
jgi:hypothetical protein